MTTRKKISAYLATEIGKAISKVALILMGGAIMFVYNAFDRGVQVGGELDNFRGEVITELKVLKKNDSLLFLNDKVQVNNDIIISNKQDSILDILKEINIDQNTTIDMFWNLNSRLDDLYKISTK